MSLTTLQLTQFKVQKLQCIGDRRRAAPYQITTYDGMELGSFGVVMEPAMEASNATDFAHHGFHGMRRLLKVFGR
jgi:hypothetical protein